jgi:SanA protein
LSLFLKIIFLSVILLVGAFIFIFLYSKRFIFKTDQYFKFKYALVLGAGLEKDGKPSDILLDRIQTAVEVYKKNKVEYLILSGSTRKGYNEPEAMRAAVIALGIPQSGIQIDPTGISTFHSCLHILRDYSPESILIITQQFHLPRAILLQRWLGVAAFGIAAKNFSFSVYKKCWWYLREVFALPFNLLKLAIYLFK